MSKKFQVFTSKTQVDIMLDQVGYKSELYGKKILENSCGDGNILEEVVKRYILDCKSHNYSNEAIRKGLAQDIAGYEIDGHICKKCIARLNRLTDSYGIGHVSWSIKCEDYLRTSSDIKYDFIVGNPPYITYSEISKEDRDFVKDNFDTCAEGKIDYCYAFIEKSVLQLANKGKMAYLVPTSMFKTMSGVGIRERIKPILEKILDYSEQDIFGDALVKSSIIVLDKSSHSSSIVYQNRSSKKKILKDSLSSGGKWIFKTYKGNKEKRFGDYFKVSNVVATLLNEAFLLRENQYNVSGKYVLCGEYRIEIELVKRACAPKMLGQGKKELIICPYLINSDGIVTRITETDMKQYYPGTIQYLTQYKKKLLERGADLSAKWYEYGRSQALGIIGKNKIVLSKVVTKGATPYLVSNDYVPYAGMVVTARDDVGLPLTDAVEILKSEKFTQYSKAIGTNISGTSVRITTKDLEEFCF